MERIFIKNPPLFNLSKWKEIGNYPKMNDGMEREMFESEFGSFNLSSIFNSSQFANLSDIFPGGDQELALSRVLSVLHIYVLPVIILIGIVGNTISFLVYIGTPRLCRQSSSMYLAFLAAVDNLFLVTVFVVWFGWVGVHVFMKNGWCQTILYCTYVCSFLSVWTVVSFTCERWIVVFHPLKRHSLCTRRRAIIVMTSLTVSALTFYSFSIFTTSVMYGNGGMPVCTNSKKYQSALQVIRGIDTIITVIVPSLAIIVMNMGIGIKTCRYANKKKTSQVPVDSVDDFSGFTSVNRQSETRQGHTSAMSLVPGGGRLVVNKQGPRSWRFLTRRRHTQLRITQALLIVSSVFVLLNIPSFAFHIHAFIISIRQEALDKVLQAYIWQELIQFLYYINFASRFFIYTASSRNFRYALRRLLAKLKHRLSKIFSPSQRRHLRTLFQSRM